VCLTGTTATGCCQHAETYERAGEGTKTSYCDRCLLFITAQSATSDTAGKFTTDQGVLSACGLIYNMAVSLSPVVACTEHAACSYVTLPLVHNSTYLRRLYRRHMCLTAAATHCHFFLLIYS